MQSNWSLLVASLKLGRTRLEDVADLAGLRIVRDSHFGFPAKILTPWDDLLVPLFSESALADLTSRGTVSAVITTEEFVDRLPPSIGVALTESPLVAHHVIHKALASVDGKLWRRFRSRIDSDANIDASAVVAEHNVVISAGAQVGPLAVIGEKGVIGAARIGAGAVVGSDAYEIVLMSGEQQLRSQTGGYEIDDRVEILSGTVVTRSAFCGRTVIGAGAVLDCNVTVSHDAAIGANARIGGNSWIGGRATIGERASVGPGAVIANGLTVGDDARISLGAIVTRDVAAGERVSGNFAIPHDRFLENLRSLR